MKNAPWWKMRFGVHIPSMWTHICRPGPQSGRPTRSDSSHQAQFVSIQVKPTSVPFVIKPNADPLKTSSPTRTHSSHQAQRRPTQVSKHNADPLKSSSPTRTHSSHQAQLGPIHVISTNSVPSKASTNSIRLTSLSPTRTYLSLSPTQSEAICPGGLCWPSRYRWIFLWTSYRYQCFFVINNTSI